MADQGGSSAATVSHGPLDFTDVVDTHNNKKQTKKRRSGSGDCQRFGCLSRRHLGGEICADPYGRRGKGYHGNLGGVFSTWGEDGWNLAGGALTF